MTSSSRLSSFDLSERLISKVDIIIRKTEGDGDNRTALKVVRDVLHAIQLGSQKGKVKTDTDLLHELKDIHIRLFILLHNVVQNCSLSPVLRFRSGGSGDPRRRLVNDYGSANTLVAFVRLPTSKNAWQLKAAFERGKNTTKAVGIERHSTVLFAIAHVKESKQEEGNETTLRKALDCVLSFITLEDFIMEHFALHT